MAHEAGFRPPWASRGSTPRTWPGQGPRGCSRRSGRARPSANTRRSTERREFADAQAVAALEDAHQLVEVVSCFRVYAKMTWVWLRTSCCAVDGPVHEVRLRVFLSDRCGTRNASCLFYLLETQAASFGRNPLGAVGVWGAMERKVRLATAVSGVSERPELAPSDRFRYGERVAFQQVDVLVAER